MRWRQSSFFAVLACMFTLLPESVFTFPGGNSTFATSTPSSSLFSTALRSRRMFDTSLQSSIIKLIRELMLTPKIYESMSNAVERRADYGRVLFPGESQSQQGRSASIIVASPSRTYIQSTAAPSVPSPPPAPSGMRTMSLSSRTMDNMNSNKNTYHNNPNIYEEGGILRKVRAGKVERVPRPIIINGNSAAFHAPRYNRMLEGPAPTIGGTSAIKIPPPSVIMSQPLRIIEGNRDSRGRSLKEIDVQGVRVIVGQRVPDDPEDKLFTWRNGRVIKGMFFPNDPSNSRPVNQEESNDISKPSGSLVVSNSYDF